MINNELIARIHKRFLAIPLITFARKHPSSFRIFLMKKINGIQLSTSQLLLITKTILKTKNPLFLVFGLGNDSLFWHHINLNGKTVFLEDNNFWLQTVTSRNKELTAYNVNYNTKREQWQTLLSNPDSLQMNLHEKIHNNKWDIILVDAPAGYADGTPGRMQSIYMSRKLVKPGMHVFVHDCNRQVEDIYSLQFLNKENLEEEIQAPIGNLRHFRIRN